MDNLFAQIKKSNVVHLCLAISFFTSGLIINLIQCILFYGLKPFNKKLYRQIGYYLCYSLYSQIVFIADWWSNSKLYIYCEEETRKKYLGKEHTLLLMNHTYEIDWLIGWMLCEKVGVLGNCKAYAKKAISYIPAVGWAWKFAEFVFLERSYDKDKEIIGRQISEIYDYPDPVWLLLNAEGTRFTKSKHDASVQFARERGWTELKHHLIPRTKGFASSLPALKAKCPSILDIQLVFKTDDKVEPTLGNLLHGRGVTGYMYVRRIDMKDVPSDEKGASEWMQELFRQKDKIHDSFLTHGDFFTGSGVKPVEPIVQPASIATLANTVFWLIATLTPILYYLVKLLFSGELIHFSLGVGIIAVFYILLQKSIAMSKISKGSTYGATANSASSLKS